MSTQPIAKKTHFYQIIAQIGYFHYSYLSPYGIFIYRHQDSISTLG